MSEKWYPVINYEKCIECGACVEMCPNGVYEKDTMHPNVIHPENCCDGGKGCQSKCPAEAIEYVGDTGAAVKCECGSGSEDSAGDESGCGCGCSCGSDSGCC